MNVLWGLFNLGTAYVLLVVAADLDLKPTLQLAISAVRREQPYVDGVVQNRWTGSGSLQR